MVFVNNVQEKEQEIPLNRKVFANKIILLLAAVLLALFTAGCSRRDNCGECTLIPPEKGALKIVATVFPVYDWARNILGTNPAGAELKLLYDNGVDPHSFQPTASDIVEISSCDLFIYVGGESDDWAADLLEEAINQDIRTVNLMQVLGDKAIEEEQIQTAEENKHEEEEPEYDEHIWLSLRNAAVLCDAIEGALQEADPSHADIYKENLEDYRTKLGELDIEYQKAIQEADLNTLLFADRFPFLYLVNDYGLDHYAAFNGCSAETEASFETIIFLTQKINELHLPAVLVIEGSDGKIAQTIIRNTDTKDQNLLILDSLQTAPKDGDAQDRTYLAVMKDNLEMIKKALITNRGE